MYKIEEKFKNFVQLLLLAIIYPIFKWWITSKQIWNTCFKGNISTNLTRKSTATETIHLIPLISPQKVGKEGGGGKRSHFSRETNATMVHPPPFQTISISHPTPVHSTPPPLLCNDPPSLATRLVSVSPSFSATDPKVDRPRFQSQTHRYRQRGCTDWLEPASTLTLRHELQISPTTFQA